MQCPECHQRMQIGYIPSGGGINWFKHLPPEGSLGFAEALPGTSLWFRRAMLEAYRCRQCQLVLFRYGAQVEDPKTFEHK